MQNKYDPYKQDWKNKKGNQMEVSTKETVAEINDYGVEDIPDRGLRKETLDRFGCKVGKDVETGALRYIYFPSVNEKGIVTGYKRQDTFVDKEAKGHWCAIGSVTIGNKLFGQDVAESVSRKRQFLTLTEGELDTLSTYQALMDSVKNTKYAGMEPFVCSIPLGTKNAVESVLHNVDFVKSFDGLTIFFDNDTVTPKERLAGVMRGREAREAVAGALLGTGIKISTIEAGEGLKDASDYLQKGKEDVLAKLVQFEKKPFTPEKILKSADITLDEVMKPKEEGIYVPEFPALMEKIHGFREGEFVLITSPSGVGKSLNSFLIADAIVKKNKKVGMIFLEETVVETKRRFIAQKLKINFLKFNNNPEKAALEKGLTSADIARANAELDADENICYLNHFGSMPISDLMNKVRHLHFVEGCNFIFLDHISLLISGERVDDERKELDLICTELASFCAGNKCGIIAVSHINRSVGEGFKPPKGKEDEPFWVRVTASMLRGSAALEQLSFIVLGIEPEILPSRERGRVRWVVLKNRPWSYLGEGDTFTMNQDDWTVVLSNQNNF